jgi:hypothetical protein
VVIPAASILVIIFTAVGLPQTIGAALGHGTRGTFTALQWIPSRYSGSWTGTFTPANGGPAIQNISTDDITGLRTGSTVPALDNGGEVYAAHGSKEWVFDLLLLIAGVVVLVGWCWRVPLWYLRQRGS